jgi:putative transcriptional regulator
MRDPLAQAGSSLLVQGFLCWRQTDSSHLLRVAPQFQSAQRPWKSPTRTHNSFEAADMTIRVRLNVMLAERNVKSKDLAEFVGITEANLSLLKQGKVKGVRFDTLDRICQFLDCQPGDLLRHEPGTDG